MRTTRKGFTLIELMVAMSFMVFLATLCLYGLPKLFKSERLAAAGADQLMTFMHKAKQRALKTQIPTGVRLQLDKNKMVTQLVMIEQENGYYQGVVTTTGNVAHYQPFLPSGDPATDLQIPFRGVDLSQYVQAGDYLCQETSLNRRSITAIQTNYDASRRVWEAWLTLSSPLLHDCPQTTQYSVERMPRPIVGETAVLLPNNIAIDCNTNFKYQNYLTFTDASQTVVDILFEPSGKVMGVGDQRGTFFWVRDITLDDVWKGEPVIVTLKYQTGFLKACPVDPTGGTPYTFAQNDKISGW